MPSLLVEMVKSLLGGENMLLEEGFTMVIVTDDGLGLVLFMGRGGNVEEGARQWRSSKLQRKSEHDHF
ncbi:hypothetical protein SRABI96_03158 [Peribacillus sp. Bi96]|uniref:hypothetical protein n=1 Tax=unclassified Peribacillus TaxID=2675266 RepID=UPI001D35805D|nr:hypothetical protein [Peribacillus sp. Bi96]CAH0250208.1 hypothetical protein SRABI96_03158 [Peribacillus sp. Bi96]